MTDVVSSDRALALNRLEPPLDPQRVFGRRAPLEVEIGCGKGLFLITEAKRLSEHDFLGIEVVSKYFKWTLQRVERAGLSNVRVVREEAAYFIARYLPPGSVARFHLYYPDPWPKRRHHKRRIFTDSFLEAITARLEPGGELRVATDYEAYHRVMHEVIERAEGLERVEGEEAWEHWVTNFGRKYEREGRGVFRERLRKPVRA